MNPILRNVLRSLNNNGCVFAPGDVVTWEYVRSYDRLVHYPGAGIVTKVQECFEKYCWCEPTSPRVVDPPVLVHHIHIRPTRGAMAKRKILNIMLTESELDFDRPTDPESDRSAGG